MYKELKMRFTRIVFALFTICMAQMSCSAPRQAYPGATLPPIYARIPAVIKRGEEALFVVPAATDSVCHAGIGYYTISGQWIHEDLPSVDATEGGDCKWTWNVPSLAADGTAEFRAYIEKNGNKRNIFPAEFCIEKCP